MGLLTRMSRKYEINSNSQVFSTIKAMDFRDKVVPLISCGNPLALLNSGNIQV